MNKKVTKAVIPVAGMGTRFLPMTKVVPKELLPIVDKPALQYVVEEAVNSGINEIILVTSKEKKSLQDYLSPNPEYDSKLKKAGKEHLLDELNTLINKIEVKIAYQDEPKGLGHAVHCAKDIVGDEPFVLILPDVIIKSDPPCSKQMINAYNETGKGIIYTEHMPQDRLSLYGILDVEGSGPIYRINDMVEKPKPENAPSDLIIVGRYLLPASIFHYLEETRPGYGGEIQLTDALRMITKNEGLLALEHEATTFDTGDKLNFLKANIYYSLKDKRFEKEIKEFLNSFKS